MIRLADLLRNKHFLRVDNEEVKYLLQGRKLRGGTVWEILSNNSLATMRVLSFLCKHIESQVDEHCTFRVLDMSLQFHYFCSFSESILSYEHLARVLKNLLCCNYKVKKLNILVFVCFGENSVQVCTDSPFYSLVRNLLLEISLPKNNYLLITNHQDVEPSISWWVSGQAENFSEISVNSTVREKSAALKKMKIF